MRFFLNALIFKSWAREPSTPKRINSEDRKRFIFESKIATIYWAKNTLFLLIQKHVCWMHESCFCVYANHIWGGKKCSWSYELMMFGAVVVLWFNTQMTSDGNNMPRASLLFVEQTAATWINSMTPLETKGVQSNIDFTSATDVICF